MCPVRPIVHRENEELNDKNCAAGNISSGVDLFANEQQRDRAFSIGRTTKIQYQTSRSRRKHKQNPLLFTNTTLNSESKESEENDVKRSPFIGACTARSNREPRTQDQNSQEGIKAQEKQYKLCDIKQV